MQPCHKTGVITNIRKKTEKLQKNDFNHFAMKTIKLFGVITGAAALLALTSCLDDFTIRGNGITENEGRFVTPFRQVHSSGEFIVHVSAGDEYQVWVNAESNLLPYIDTDSERGALKISVHGVHHLRNTRPMEVYVVTPRLNGIKLSGSGVITTDFFTDDHFELALSGSGQIQSAIDAGSVDISVSGSGILDLSGVADEAEFRISGSGKIYSYNLALLDCEAAISGSGDMFVNVSRFLEASISGSGNVFFVGNPLVHTHLSGSGKVIKEY